jgi:hypothetical protein
MGRSVEEIATQLGVRPKTAYHYLHDPDGSKLAARKASYAGVCARCGDPTDGSGGRAKASKHCTKCAREIEHEQRYWTRERVLEALNDIEAFMDRPFTARDLNPWMHPDPAERELGIALHRERNWPHPDMVGRELGDGGTKAWRVALAEWRAR